MAALGNASASRALETEEKRTGKGRAFARCLGKGGILFHEGKGPTSCPVNIMAVIESFAILGTRLKNDVLVATGGNGISCCSKTYAMDINRAEAASNVSKLCPRIVNKLDQL